MNNYSDLNCTAEVNVPGNYTMACKLADINALQLDSIEVLNSIYVQMFGGTPTNPNKPESKCMDNDLDTILGNAKTIKNALYDLAGRIGIC